MQHQSVIRLELEELGKALDLRPGMRVVACVYDFLSDTLLVKIEGDSLPAVIPNSGPIIMSLTTLEDYQMK